jgi:hypothetical protein
MQSDIVYPFNGINCEQTYMAKTDGQAIRRMEEHGAPKSAFKQQTTTDRDTDEHQLRRSSLEFVTKRLISQNCLTTLMIRK